MLQQTSKCCYHGEGKREGADSVEVVKKVSALTRWHWRWCSVEASTKEEQACGGGGMGSMQYRKRSREEDFSRRCWWWMLLCTPVRR
jgi:hypothetical protein